MDSGERISEHISYEEATESATAERLGIENIPSEEAIAAMKLIARKVFEPLRKFWKWPIWISSFYRCPEVNKGLRGSKTSQHMSGEAMDIDAQVYGHLTNRDVFEYIRGNCQFDQLIWEEGTDLEPAWVHVSYSAKGNRMQVLRKYKIKGKVKYVTL